MGLFFLPTPSRDYGEMVWFAESRIWQTWIFLSRGLAFYHCATPLSMFEWWFIMFFVRLLALALNYGILNPFGEVFCSIHSGMHITLFTAHEDVFALKSLCMTGFIDSWHNVKLYGLQCVCVCKLCRESLNSHWMWPFFEPLTYLVIIYSYGCSA